MVFWTRQTIASGVSHGPWDAECRSAAPKTLQGMKLLQKRGVGGLGAPQRIGETLREKAKKNEQMQSGWVALEHVACMRSWTFNEVVSQAPDQLLVPHGSQYGMLGADLPVPMGGSFCTIPCFLKVHWQAGYETIECWGG